MGTPRDPTERYYFVFLFWENQRMSWDHADSIIISTKETVFYPGVLPPVCPSVIRVTKNALASV